MKINQNKELTITSLTSLIEFILHVKDKDGYIYTRYARYKGLTKFLPHPYS